MGKFFKYEDSNWRSFIINTTDETIKRPKRKVTKADFLGAVVNVDGFDCIVVNAGDIEGGFMATLPVYGMVALNYNSSTDVFTFVASGGSAEPVTLTNIMIDEYGREEMYI